MLEKLSHQYVRSEATDYKTPLPDRLNRAKLQALLLQGSRNSDSIVHALQKGIISEDEVFTAGSHILEAGQYTSTDGTLRPLTSTIAGNVLIAMMPRGTHLHQESPREVAYSRINQHSVNGLPPKIRLDAQKYFKKARFNELQARTLHMLAQGHLDFFAHTDKKPSEETQKTGIAFIEGLATIPEFKRDFDKWCEGLLSIPTSDGATLPHIFPFLIQELGLSNTSGEEVLYALRNMYKSENGRERIKNQFVLAIANTATGDRHAKLDELTLPLVADTHGKAPGWVELTVSKGVVMLGTLDRMRNGGMQPTWMAADLYRYDELWKYSDKYLSVSDPRNPWLLLPYSKSDPAETRARVDEVFHDPRYVGFVKGNFEKPDFTPRVLHNWREKTNTRYPDVVRMTGTIGVTAQSMTNMVDMVNPNGGLIIMSGGWNALTKYDTSVWKVNKNENGTLKIKPILTSPFSSTEVKVT